jgi:hypothetical protein
MEYERYQPKYSRPAGMGAFFDYGIAVAKLYAPKKAAEQLWDGEGGNSHLRIARRAGPYKR